MAHHVLRKVLMIAVVILAVWFGVKLGELRALCGAFGHHQWNQGQYFQSQ
jgi:hypothetical protein